MTRDATDRTQALQQQLAELTQQYESLHRRADAAHGAFDAERRRAARYAAIARIGRLISSSLSLHDIFQTAVEAIYEQLDFAYIAAGIVDADEPAFLRLIAHCGIFARAVPPDYRHSINDGIVGEAARARQQILVENVAHDERYLSLVGPTIQAELATPILMGERLLGVLNVESERPISAGDAEGIAIIADQLAVALDHALLFARTQRTLDETQLIASTSQRISTAMTVDDVVRAYLEQVAWRKQFVCTVVLYTFDELGQRAGVHVRGFWSPQSGMQLLDHHIPYQRDVLDETLDAGQIITMADVHSDPRASAFLRDLQRQDGRPALAFIPLMVRNQRIGLVVLSYEAVYPWPAAELQPYLATAAQLATAIDSRRQQQSLFEQGQQVAVMEERRRLARDLHDSVTQSLFSMSLLAQVVPELWDIDPAESRAMLAQMRDLTRSALAEMRALLFELRPAALGEHELAQALTHHAAIFAQRTGVEVLVEVDGAPTVPSAIEQALFRIAQEALTNVARHAHARSVRMTLESGPPVRLQIIDDGQGFDPARVADGHLGLVSIHERAATINASVMITAADGQGTRVLVQWPASDERKRENYDDD